ncbi:MAG: hypothetical protein HDT47_02965 [Ruminococcaceae bacterium]|nr:hypothetical protein [Oscillospiraceae bacterium]
MSQGITERLHSEEEQQRAAAFNNAAQLRVAIPGIVESFDAEKQTVSVQPSITENIQVGEAAVNATKLPILTDIPICFPRAGGYSITLPVKKGDECLLVFADMCIDGWWQSGGVQDQMETRRHDLSDAFAIIGTTSQPRKVAEYHPDNLHIRTDDSSIVIELDKSKSAVNIKCEGNLAIDVGGNISIKAGGETLIQAAGENVIKGAKVNIN